MSWEEETFGNLLIESRIPSENPDVEKRIRVKLNAKGVEKRPIGVEKEGATNQFIRKAGQFIYGKQNFHKGAFGIVPDELDGFETSADIPSFDVREDCLAEWIFYFFKIGDKYAELEQYARGVGSKRIHPKQIEDLRIPLPPIELQNRLIKRFKDLECGVDAITNEFTHQLDLVKQLRQAFLREAMQGKLVPQDPNDEPASVLLEKIKAEKERLIKEKKIKKDKPLPPITEDEIPYELPEGWVWCRLDTCCLVIVDCPHSTPNYIESDSEYFGIDTNCINQKGEITYLRGLSKESYLERVARLVPQENDIVYSREGSIGLATLIPSKKNICLGQRVMLLRPSKFILPVYLKYHITEEGYKNKLLEKHRGIGAKHVNVKDIIMSLIAIPPLSEQHRIVAKLDELMQYCDQLEAGIKQSQQHNEQLLQQVLRETLEG